VLPALQWQVQSINSILYTLNPHWCYHPYSGRALYNERALNNNERAFMYNEKALHSGRGRALRASSGVGGDYHASYGVSNLQGLPGGANGNSPLLALVVLVACVLVLVVVAMRLGRAPSVSPRKGRTHDKGTRTGRGETRTHDSARKAAPSGTCLSSEAELRGAGGGGTASSGKSGQGEGRVC
jgi:hypothetical protein